MIEQDHAIGHVLLDPIARQAPFAALGGYDRRELSVLEPIEQASQLGSDNGFIGNARKQRVDRVEHDATRAYAFHRVIEADKQGLEIVLTGLMHLLPLNFDVVGREQAAFFKAGQIKAKRGDVHAEIVNPFVERNQEARLPVVDRAAHKEGGRKQGLAATGAAAHKRGSTCR